MQNLSLREAARCSIRPRKVSAMIRNERCRAAKIGRGWYWLTLRNSMAARAATARGEEAVFRRSKAMPGGVILAPGPAR